MSKEFEEFKQAMKTHILNVLEVGVNDPELANKMVDKGLGTTKTVSQYADIGEYKYNLMGKI